MINAPSDARNPRIGVHIPAPLSYARFMGTLYYGDNVDILRRYLKDEAVDLLETKGIECPSTIAALDETFKKAPEAKAKGHEQHEPGL